MTTPADLLDASRLTFGVGAPSTVDGVRAFEDLGVESLWVGGHISSRNPTPESMVSLARLSAMSTTAPPRSTRNEAGRPIWVSSNRSMRS